MKRSQAPKAFAIYSAFTAALYWPLVAGLRFFWEDFTNQEYPIREFAFRALGLQHHIPFWNPYSWAWSVFAGDPQTALWYPTNLLQIILTRILVPSVQHLPVLIPELMTISHFPIAALGCFLLARTKFKLDFLPALIAGFLFGFGTKMVAEQNHQMQLYQTTLLPWMGLLMLQSMKSYRWIFPFALVLGISFLAGQPQVSLFNLTFLGCWFVYELWQERRDGYPLSKIGKTTAVAVSGIALAVALGAAQSIPSYELSGASARSALPYSEATGASLQYGQLLNFFMPRVLGENPAEQIPQNPTMIGGTSYHWEAAFSWTIIGEILTLFAVWQLWKRRKDGSNPWTRYLPFFLWFTVFAFLFALGPNIYLQWLFWRFVPLFGRVRAPIRMLIYVWFGGAIYAGIGMQILLRLSGEERERTKRFFLKALIPFIVICVLAGFDVPGILTHSHRGNVWYLALPTLTIALLSFAILWKVLRERSSVRSISMALTCLILIDLFYTGITWHRSSVNPQQQFEDAEHSVAGRAASRLWSEQMTKVVAAHGDLGAMVRNAGMYFRAPIESGDDSNSLKNRNPLRLTRSMVPSASQLLQFRIMGVGAIVDTTRIPAITYIDSALPFLKLYDRWSLVQRDSEVARRLQDSSFDYRHLLLVEGSSVHQPGSDSIPGKILASTIHEDSIRCTTDADHPTMLLVNDLYYFKWRALVDGKETPILRAYSALRAVPIPNGRNEVLLYYDGSSVYFGLKITLAALAVCVGGTIAGFGRRKSRTSNPE